MLLQCKIVSLLYYGAKRHFQQYFSYIMAVSFIGGGNRTILRKSLTCRKSWRLRICVDVWFNVLYICNPNFQDGNGPINGFNPATFLSQDLNFQRHLS
jgi:hypothetical protein